MELIIASNNSGKIAEIAGLLPDIPLRSMRDIGYDLEIPEPYDTFAANAYQKAMTIYRFCGKAVLADDSGLCVDALKGGPGVFSARYAGDPASDEANNIKLLQELTGVRDRSAHYIAILCLILEGTPYYFTGRCDGHIALRPEGSSGFGYDPLFIPEAYNRTFGELDSGIKKQISHRAKALHLLCSSGLLRP